MLLLLEVVKRIEDATPSSEQQIKRCQRILTNLSTLVGFYYLHEPQSIGRIEPVTGRRPLVSGPGEEQDEEESESE